MDRSPAGRSYIIKTFILNVIFLNSCSTIGPFYKGSLNHRNSVSARDKTSCSCMFVQDSLVLGFSLQ